MKRISGFFFNDTATTEIYTLSLHDALPILDRGPAARPGQDPRGDRRARALRARRRLDRKSTRLNSSHQIISYAVFCLKKKNGAARAGGNGENQRSHRDMGRRVRPMMAAAVA